MGDLIMNNYRCYGKEPYKIAVVHGGPGAPGSVAAIARELSREWGVLEPIQTKTSLDGQVLELYETLCEQGDLPFILIGHSWGAWLSFILAARYPSLVRKLVLVSSGPFEAMYVRLLKENRYSRMSCEEKSEFESIIEYLCSEATDKKDEKLARLGELVEKVDNLALVPVISEEKDKIQVQGDTFQQVWNEAEELRRSGLLLEYSSRIQCPVIAIHGDYDPHPAEGVRMPLSKIIKDFKFYLLEKCGHSPWKEHYAKEEFYRILRGEIETTE